MLGIDAKVTRVSIDRKYLEQIMLQLNAGVVRVGFPSGGPIDPESEISVAEKAIFNEYGSNNGRVPPRPFMRQTVGLTRETLKALKAGLISRIYKKTTDARGAMEIIGEWYSGQIKYTITTAGAFIPNAQSTADRKGSSKPLIDTKQMMNSIVYKVEGI